jgi:lipopolysaccharide export system protein LptC
MNVKTRPAIIFPLALLSMLALMTLWINNIVQPAVPKLDGSSRHDPDYVVSNFVTTQTDINGNLRYKLAAIEMKHFPDDDTSVLQRPRYTQFAVNKPYTQVQSLRGYVSSNGKEIDLFDNVKVTRQAFAGKGEMTVDTDHLNILPNDEIARTESPVIIRQAPKTVIYATGMLYEKKKHTVTLLHKVRAHYERPIIQNTAAGAAKTSKASRSKNTKNKPNRSDASKSSKPTATGIATTKPLTTSSKKSAKTKADKKNLNTSNVRIRRHYASENI